MNFKAYIAFTVLTLLIVTLLSVSMVDTLNSGLYIVVTFPNLIYDVEPLLCSGDYIVSIAPTGVDPHEYQLTPANVEDLRKADIIISTGHAPFEKNIEEIVGREIRGELVIIPKIPNIRILTNPATGKPNYHMPIYDPNNYILFIKYVSEVLAHKRPECANHYYERAEDIVDEVSSLINRTPKVNVIAAADTPTTQYAVSWIGIRIKYLMIKEHGVPASPKDIESIVEAMKNGEIKLAIINNPPRAKASESLKELAEKYNIPILYVPNPIGEGSILNKLTIISNQISNLSIETSEETASLKQSQFTIGKNIVTALLSLLLLFIVGFFIFTKARGV